jgi:hypothetical protein
MLYALICVKDYINGVLEDSLFGQQFRESIKYEKAEELLQDLHLELEYTSRARCEEVLIIK